MYVSKSDAIRTVCTGRSACDTQSHRPVGRVVTVRYGSVRARTYGKRTRSNSRVALSTPSMRVATAVGSSGAIKLSPLNDAQDLENRRNGRLLRPVRIFQRTSVRRMISGA